MNVELSKTSLYSAITQLLCALCSAKCVWISPRKGKKEEMKENNNDDDDTIYHTTSCPISIVSNFSGTMITIHTVKNPTVSATTSR